MLQGKTIVLGVCGSIAAYKAANLASMLVKQHADVHVIMTRNACQFITPVTFETLTSHKCLVDTFDRQFEFNVEHVALAKRADIALVAPATANVIGKLASGIADDMLTTTLMACPCPKLIAPAMNTMMFNNPIVQDNLAKLSRFGYQIIAPASGRLACGDTGAGKLPSEEVLVDAIEQVIALPHDLAGKRILINAGPTQESIDPVRFITNHSTGKMGYALARMARLRGAQVTLVSGPVHIPAPMGVDIIQVKSAAQMYQAVTEAFPHHDIAILCAAVADYTPAQYSEQKMKKGDSDGLTLELQRTADILKQLGASKNGKQKVIGFSMETENMVENSRAKLIKKNADMICANSIAQPGTGFAADTNLVTLITPDAVRELPFCSKDETARMILDAIVQL